MNTDKEYRRRVTHAFTVDVEDWFHILDCPQMPRPDEYDHLSSRVENNTRAVLELLKAKEVTGTFFVLGWVADRFPGLVREIHNAGHEIGVHGYHHLPAYEMSDEQLLDDTRRAVEAVGNAIGQAPAGYRSPGGSLLARQKWIFDELLTLGVWFDSSIFPRPGGLAESEGFPDRPYIMRTLTGQSIWEFPSVTRRWLGMTWCYAEGGYMRLLPYGLVASWMKKDEVSGRSVMLCLHPREIDTDQPKLRLAPFKQWKTQVGIAGCYEKVERLLSQFEFSTMGGILSSLADDRR